MGLFPLYNTLSFKHEHISGHFTLFQPSHQYDKYVGEHVCLDNPPFAAGHNSKAHIGDRTLFPMAGLDIRGLEGDKLHIFPPSSSENYT